MQNEINNELSTYEKFKETAPKAFLLLMILTIHITMTGRIF